MSKKLARILVLVCLAGYSYSNYFYNSTNNAAANGLTWTMDNILPEYNGLAVNGVYYSYTPQKVKEDDFKVTVQNINTNGGYVFREVDDWSGKSGGVEIRKVLGFEYLPREIWGDGSIQTEGTGTIQNANVVYSYRYEDKCKTPLDDPTCAGYSDAVLDLIPEQAELDIYNALEDENLEKEESKAEYEEEEKKEQKKEDKEEDLEYALAINEEVLEFGNAAAQNQLLAAMNLSVQIGNYYNKTIDGGTYEEKVVLQDSELPDNGQSMLFNLGSDYRHKELVDSQYNRGE